MTPKPVSRWPYRLRAFHPRYWLRQFFADKTYDAWLWEQLQDPANVSADLTYPYACHNVCVSGKKVWVANPGFADGAHESPQSDHRFDCSRSTAIRLQELAAPLLPKKVKPRFVP